MFVRCLWGVCEVFVGCLWGVCRGVCGVFVELFVGCL